MIPASRLAEGFKAFTDGKVYLVWESDNPGGGREIRFSRSIDDAQTFTSWTSLDAAAPVPTTASYSSRLTTDGAGHVWAAWLDESAGAAVPQFVVRHSGDGGATWGTVYRLDRKTPQGA